MNANRLITTPEKTSDFAISTTNSTVSGKNPQDDCNGSNTAFSKVLTQAAKQNKNDVSNDKASKKIVANDEDPVDMTDFQGILGVLPLGGMPLSQQEKGNDTEQQNVAAYCNAVQGGELSTPVSDGGKLKSNLIALGSNEKISVDVTSKEIPQPLLVKAENNLQQVNTMENSKLLQKRTIAENKKHDVLWLGKTTEKNLMTMPLKTVNNNDVTSLNILQETSKVQYKIYGIEVLPGKKNTEKLSQIDKPLLSQTSENEQKDMNKIDVVVSTENALQKKISFSSTEQNVILQADAALVDAIESKSPSEGAFVQALTEENVLVGKESGKKDVSHSLFSAGQEIQKSTVRSVQSKSIFDKHSSQDVTSEVAVTAKTSNIKIPVIDETSTSSQNLNVIVNNNGNNLSSSSIMTAMTALVKSDLSDVDSVSEDKKQVTDKLEPPLKSTGEESVYNQIQLQVQKQDDNLAHTGVKAPVGQVAPDKYEVISQIVEHAKLVNNNNNSEMVIQLKPEHLGELTFRVTVDNGAVSTTFHSNNPEVRSVIEASLHQLRQEMSNQGLKVNYVGVYAGLSQFSSQQQRENQPQSLYKFQNKKQIENDFVEAVDMANVISQPKTITDLNGIDYRV